MQAGWWRGAMTVGARTPGRRGPADSVNAECVHQCGGAATAAARRLSHACIMLQIRKRGPAAAASVAAARGPQAASSFLCIFSWGRQAAPGSCQYEYMT